jgi:hypothetical protein
VADPSRDAADGKRGREDGHLEPEAMEDERRVELDVGLEPPPGLYSSSSRIAVASTARARRVIQVVFLLARDDDAAGELVRVLRPDVTCLRSPGACGARENLRGSASRILPPPRRSAVPLCRQSSAASSIGCRVISTPVHF